MERIIAIFEEIETKRLGRPNVYDRLTGRDPSNEMYKLQKQLETIEQIFSELAPEQKSIVQGKVEYVRSFCREVWNR